MTLAGKMRQAAKDLGKFRPSELADKIGTKTYREREKVRHTILDFFRRGEMKRVAPGLYEYVSRAKTPTKRQRLWNVVRRMNGPYFTGADLEQLTGLKRITINEFCGWMVRDGHATRIKRGYFRRRGILSVEVPKNDGKAEKLRNIRRMKARKLKAQSSKAEGGPSSSRFKAGL